MVALCFSAAEAQEVECDYEGSQREMNACALRDYKAADAALNQAYKRVQLQLSKRQVEALRVEQRQWIRRRDSVCGPKRKEPGTNATIDYFTCLQTFTELRTLQLRTR